MTIHSGVSSSISSSIGAPLYRLVVATYVIVVELYNTI